MLTEPGTKFNNKTKTKTKIKRELICESSTLPYKQRHVGMFTPVGETNTQIQGKTEGLIPKEFQN